MPARSRHPNAGPDGESPMPLARVVIELRESISLRTDDGLFFGDLLRFGAGRMEVETDGRFELRAEIEFQLKLPGFNATVYGVARVLRAISRTALLRQYTLRVLKMRDSDRIALQRWVDYTARGQSGYAAGLADSDQPYDPARDPNPWGIGSLDSSLQTQSGKLALRDAMRARFTPSSAGPRSRSGASGLRSSDSAQHHAVPFEAPQEGPAAERERRRLGPSDPLADRAGAASRQRGEAELPDSEGPRSPAARPPRRLTQREIRRPPLIEVEGARNPKLPSSKDPQVHLRLATDPPQIFVRYNTRSGYFGDWQSYLSKNVLFLQNTEETPKKGSIVQVNIFLPAGLSVNCDALVIATLPTGFGLNLRLDAESRLTLSSASRI
ncbi:MAG: hypothetical protein ABIO70_08150 [Pseudomonadota bacterium]